MKIKHCFFIVLSFFLFHCLPLSLLAKNNNLPTTSIANHSAEERDKNNKPKVILKDPFISFNVLVFRINQWLDFGPLSPLYKIYDTSPHILKASISNFVAHCNLPLNFINALLQGKIGGALRHLQRFLVNSIFGFGLFDVAKSSLNIYEKPTGFGQTLIKWGYRQDKYVMVPILGPCSIIHGIGKVVDFALQPLSYFWYAGWTYYILYYIDNKVPLEKFLRSFEKGKDPYDSLKTLYSDFALKV